MFKTTNEESKEIMESLPEIKSLQVEYVVQGKGYGAGLDPEKCQKHVFDEKTISHLIPCSNELCHNGGFLIVPILRHMINQKLSHWEDSQTCFGNETSEKGRKIYRRCLNHFIIKVDVEYKK